MTEQNADNTINTLQNKVDAIIQDKPTESISQDKPIKPKKPRKDSITLNKREKAFVYHRARGNNLIVSVTKAGYKPRTNNQASIQGWSLEKKEKIIKALEIEKVNLFDIKMITADYVLDLLNDIAVNGEKETNRLTARIQLGKYRELALFTENLKIIDTDEDKEFRLERLQRLEKNRVKAHQEN